MKNTLPIFITAISFLILLIGINRPLTGQHDWNSVVYSNIARNHLRLGLSTTKLAMVTNSGLAPNTQLHYFTHYPPLMPLLLSTSFFVFGITDWAARLVPILSVSLMIFFSYKLAEKLFDVKTAVLTSVFLTLSPITIYYSKIPVHETVVLGFTAMTIWFYVLWQKTKVNKWYKPLLLSLILCQLTSWSGFYLSLYLPLHWIFFNSKSLSAHKTKLLIIFLLAPAVFTLHNLHTYLTSGMNIKESLFDVMLFRLNIGDQAAMFNFRYLRFFELQARWITIYFTTTASTLSLIWLITFIIRRVSKLTIRFRESIIILLLVFGFTHNAIFRNLAFIHDYMIIYALPFFALSAAVVVSSIFKKIANKRVATSIVVLIILLFSVERISYLKALFKSGDNNPAHPLAFALNTYTKPESKIIILSPDYMRFFDVFTSYYADRHIVNAKRLSDNRLNDFNHVAIPKSHDYVSPTDKRFLYQNYRSIDTSNAIIFQIK